MWSAIASPSGFRSGAIAFLARLARSQGATFPQEVKEKRVTRRKYGFIILLFFKCDLNLGLNGLNRFRSPESAMDECDLAVFSNKVSGGHSFWPHLCDKSLRVIEDHRETWRESFEEPCRIFGFFVGSNSHDDQALALIFFIEPVVGRECLAAGLTPGCPKVVENDFALCRGQYPSNSKGFWIWK